ncbi:MAG: radical SAM protein [Rhodospirillales bacterium]|jgi:hypothetical protein
MTDRPPGKIFVIPFLEMDVAFACDLHCPNCTHYSNYGLKGYVPFALGSEWLRAWARRLIPKTFSLLGGEPTLNPDLLSYLDLIAELWPGSERALISNGLGLHRHPGLFERLAATKTRLEVSFHSFKDPDYVQRFNEALMAIETARQRLGFDFVYRPNETTFYRTYRGQGAGMRPYEDKEPHASWTECYNKLCCTIHEGRLWKCPPLAFLGKVVDRFGLRAVPEWQPYLAYRPLAPDVSDEVLHAFFRHEEILECAMCPARLEFSENGLVTRIEAAK